MPDRSSDTGGEASRWDWRSKYRVWRANRKPFAYPENYLEPEPDSSEPAANATPKSTSDGEAETRRRAPTD